MYVKLNKEPKQGLGLNVCNAIFVDISVREENRH